MKPFQQVVFNVFNKPTEAKQLSFYSNIASIVIKQEITTLRNTNIIIKVHQREGSH